MNYYIQGDAANADKINAAFKKLGIDVLDFGFADKTLVYCSIGGAVQCLPYSINLMHILYSHPDYKELELPEPKFKVGDWVVIDNRHNSIYQVESVCNYDYMLKHIYGGLMPFPFSSAERLRLWSHEDVKDGDVLVTTKIRSCPFIYRKTSYENNIAYYYAGIDGNGDFSEGCLKRTLCHFGPTSDIAPATKEQRDLLFKKMKEAGYEWDAEKKELKKIKPHYDIANFHAGMEVLVRDGDDEEWNYLHFSHYRKKLSDHFFAGGNPWFQCIPFNNDTKHLLGTTDMCDEMYINW